MRAALRRLRCALRPSWHRGWVRRQVVLPGNLVVLGATMARRGVGGTVVYWTRPRCVDCGELEWS